jgi:hypothetical protein
MLKPTPMRNFKGNGDVFPLLEIPDEIFLTVGLGNNFHERTY